LRHLGAALTLLATLTLRRAIARESAGGRRCDGALRWCHLRLGLFGSEVLESFRGLCEIGRLLLLSLDFNPVLWREWHLRPPSRWMSAVWTVYTLLSLVASILALAAWDTARGEDLAALVAAFQYSIGLLFVSVSSVTSLFEERASGSLDVLFWYSLWILTP
jgi:hypothetical protein